MKLKIIYLTLKLRYATKGTQKKQNPFSLPMIIVLVVAKGLTLRNFVEHNDMKTKNMF